MKNKKANRLEIDSNWYIILLVMLLLVGSFIDNFIKSAVDNPLSAIGVFVSLFVILWGIIIWGKKRYLIAHPFKMRFSDKGPYDSGISDINKKRDAQYAHEIGHDPLFLRIKLKKEMTFEQINIRLVEKKWFGWYWKNASKNLITIQRIIDSLLEKNCQERGRFFSEQEDLNGGRDGYYKPPYYCPKDDYLYYEIKLIMNPKIKEWQGYIGFQHRRGGSHRAYAHNKITVRNILI